MINVYHFFIKKNLTGIFNVGFENEKSDKYCKKKFQEKSDIPKYISVKVMI